jgi:hypothetical protein|eukprot:g2716.t1
MASKLSDESKAGGNDSSGSDSENDEDFSLLYKANKFLGKRLYGMTTNFVDRYGHEFESAVEDGEHKLVYTELHREYVESFETMLEEFVIEACPDMKPKLAFRKFFEEAKSSVTGQFQPLFAEEDDLNRPFVDSVLAATEYDKFFDMMVDAVRSNMKK